MINLGAVAGFNQRPSILSGVGRKVKAVQLGERERLNCRPDFLKQDWHFQSVSFEGLVAPSAV
jgi:hypothetical protein